MFDVLLTDDIGRGLRASNPQTTDSVLTGLDGWVGGVSVKLDRTDRLCDGVLLEPMRREGREITVAGAVTLDTPAEAWALERYISGMFTGRGLGVITVTQDGASLTAAVQLDGTVKIATYIDPDPAVEWEIPVYAPDPCLYGPPQSTFIGQQGVGIGLRYPFFAASDGSVLHFGTAVEQSAVLTNTGNATAYPTYAITGDLPSGFTIVQGAGLVRFDGSCTADAPVTVDMAGQVTVGGQDRTWLCGEANWGGVAPGQSLSPTFSAPQGAGTCTATIYPTWL